MHIPQVITLFTCTCFGKKTSVCLIGHKKWHLFFTTLPVTYYSGSRSQTNAVVIFDVVFSNIMLSQ